MAPRNGDRQAHGLPPDAGAQFFHKRQTVSGLRAVYGRVFRLACVGCDRMAVYSEPAPYRRVPCLDVFGLAAPAA